MYADPRHVLEPERCLWYHTMDLPELGTVQGFWDLRPTVDDSWDTSNSSGSVAWISGARAAT